MSKRKIATMLTGMSTVGIISNVNSVVYATEFDDLTRSSIDSYTSKGTVSTSYYEYDSITSADANYYLGAFAIAGRYTTPGGLHSSQRIKGNGILATDTKYQYYDLNGNTRAVSGMNVIPISDGYYNYDSSWGNKWVYAGGNKYYFKNAPVSNSNSTSEIVYVAGYARIDGKLYYFREERNRHRGKLYTTSGWVDNLGGSSGRRYVYSNGEIATGIRVINGVTYIFDDNGVLQNRPIQINIPSGNVIVQEGKAYDVMTGVTSTDTAGANANSKIKIELNGFNQSNPQPGTYTIRYTLSEGGQTKTANRTIIVKGAPKIYGADDITIGVGVPFDALDGVRATDLEDGDITLTSSNVTFSTGFNPNNPQKGNYTVTYTVRDKDGNTTTS